MFTSPEAIDRLDPCMTELSASPPTTDAYKTAAEKLKAAAGEILAKWKAEIERLAVESFPAVESDRLVMEINDFLSWFRRQKEISSDICLDFERRIIELRDFNNNEESQELLANARAQFASAGNWAIHFSVVRMTISTFFIGLCWTIISVKWDDYDNKLAAATWGLWTMAGIFLVIFTWETNEETAKQKAFKSFIPLPAKPVGFGKQQKTVTKSWMVIAAVASIACLIIFLSLAGRSICRHRDLIGILFASINPTVTFLCLTIIFLIVSLTLGISLREKAEPKFLNNVRELGTFSNFMIWLPVILFLLLTICVSVVMKQWDQHAKKAKVTLTALVEPTPLAAFQITNDVGRVSNVVFNAVDLSNTSQTLGNVQQTIDCLKISLSNSLAQANKTNFLVLPPELYSFCEKLTNLVAALENLNRKPGGKQSILHKDLASISQSLREMQATLSNLSQTMPTNFVIANRTTNNSTVVEIKHIGLINFGGDAVKTK